MAGKRTYGDRCGVARALDLVGERWALLIVRELLLGPKRFTDLRTGLPHVSPDVLSQRLRELEEAGILARIKLPPPVAARVYELTQRGKDLKPIILELGRWGSLEPFPPDAEAQLGIDALVVALMTVFNPAAADGFRASYELRLGEDVFRARVAGGEFDVERGAADRPDATIVTDPATLATVLWHGRRPAEAQRAGDLEVAGDRKAAGRFWKLFSRPASQ
jgi:DNA-binding HxlR family transcriptional regulator